MTPWRPHVNLVQNGESVDAATTNRPTTDLAQRTDHLKTRLDTARLGELLVENEAALSTDTLVGHAVYKDVDGVWRPAIAGVEEDSVLGYFTLARSATVQGMVISKSTPQLGVVALFGRVTGFLPDHTVVEGLTIGQQPEYGQYYLSGITAGKLTRQRPAVGVPVCFINPTVNEVMVSPLPRDALEDHIHYRVQLFTDPAGVIRCRELGDDHIFYSTDPDSMGWLPANHAVFNGKAPDGAKFGYNIAAHEDLQKIWPPMPPASTYLSLNGVGLVTSDAPGHGVHVVVDANGIWWMDDCVYSAPWADPFHYCVDELGDPTYEDSYWDDYYGDYTYGYCGSGVVETRALTMHFVKMVAKTDASVVTRLTSDSPHITVENCKGEEKDRGDLILGFEPSYNVIPNVAGHQVVKALISPFTVHRGPVVESIRAADSTIEVVGDAVSDGKSYGNIRLRVVDPSTIQKELEVYLVALNQATEELFDNIPYLGLPPGFNSSVRFKTVVPGNGTLGAGVLTLNAIVLTTISGAALPNLSMSYRRIARPAGPCATHKVNLPLAAAEVAGISLPLNACGVMSAYQYYEVSSTPAFAVSGGDVVLVSISRSAADGYAGQVGLLRVIPVLTP